MARGSYGFSLLSILSQIKDMDPVLFKKTDLAAFFKQKAQILSELELSNLFEDLYAFNAYLGRLEGYPSIEAIPYWEYSSCLEWVDSHIMSGDLFDLNLKNARRFLGNIDRYFEYLLAMGKLKNNTQLDTAIKKICSGKKLKLITDIPFTGSETYTEFYEGGKEVRFDVADYWILILHAILFDENWTKVMEAAFGVSNGRVQKVKELKSKMAHLAKSGLRDFMYGNVTKAEADRAEAWFFDKNP